MSAKFMYSLSDENPDLQKQIGCMNGLFQLFDRHYFLGSRRIASPNHKRLPSGPNGKHGKEPKIDSQKIKENNLKKTVKEKQGFSFESPRTSLSSSSCSSGFSSAECSKASQVDRPSLSQTTFPETPRKEISNYQSNVFLQSNQHSLDLRNVVKDSIYREARGLSIKTATKLAAGRHQTLKYIDSPRPLQSPKPAKTRNTSLNESSHVLSKLHEASSSSSGCRNGSLTFPQRDAPRFSYDGRGSQDALKIKFRDFPRLSLDSRESSIKGSINSMKSNFLLEELHRSSMDSKDVRNQQQEPGSYKGPSSIVAKLMGLEALPDPTLTNGNQSRQIKTCQDLKDDPLSVSSRIDENKRNWISGSPRNSKKEPSSPRLTNADPKKPVVTRCPYEPAPWKQLDGSKGQKSTLKCRETPMKSPISSQTVYGEIEKRLTELEFKKSGKDLRALKQILEAMHKSKQILETRKEDQTSNSLSHTNSILGQSSEAPNSGKLQSSSAVSATVKGTGSPTRLKSPVKIIKPAKLTENASNSSSSVVATGSLSRLRTSGPADTRNEKVDKRSSKGLTPRLNSPRDPFSQLHSRDKNTLRTLGFNQTSKEPSPIAPENLKLAMSSETTCLKPQKKKLELEKQSRLTSPASDESRSRKQSSRLQTESGLPNWKSRHKSHNLQRSDDQLSDISSDMRDLSHQGDASSMQSESNMSAASYGAIEVTSADRSCKIEGTVSQKQEKKYNNPAARFSEGDSIAEPPRTALEQPSPISVLDATFCGDESPSPVKKKSNAFEDDEGLIPDEAAWSPIGLNHLSSCRETSNTFKTDYVKAENIHQLVRKLRNLDSIHERSIINEIEPVFNSPNPDHKYIAEILLASGLLSELESNFMAYQVHPSGHLINPNLFPALEQTKASIGLLNGRHNGRKINQIEPVKKNHRQLIFDAVNEILVRKLEKENSYKQWFSPSALGDRRPKRQQLVRDLYSEIDKLQTASKISLDDEDDSLQSILWGDLTLGSMDWTECRSDIPWVVLDVERLIFKDLICEVISGEAANSQGQPGGHCRRLLLK
ncbi:protein LONGIFOLIA 1-like [Durio zibethinus]|uniref:Protein LONGIFOLIA 1-like n=1 Tax=Durio zibethinus TaxID=66656 RepID=A0A6P6BA20_DURZI|nr:protein LONGIFOLIA 1-like [Durio zibethinus]